ncbi:MAG: hypothetical protein WHS86_13530 [Desulfosoma sp.]
MLTGMYLTKDILQKTINGADILANAGGACVSYFEAIQNVRQLLQTESDTNASIKSRKEPFKEAALSLFGEKYAFVRLPTYAIQHVV